MDETLRRQVWDRAGGVCEYCRLPQKLDILPFQIDHVIAAKHHGATTLYNLALSCFACNAFKGTNVAGIDPETGDIAPLFHARRDHWGEHFLWDGPELQGRTAIGRTTIDVLKINLPDRIEHRRLLMLAGEFPRRAERR